MPVSKSGCAAAGAGDVAMRAGDGIDADVGLVVFLCELSAAMPAAKADSIDHIVISAYASDNPRFMTGS